MTGCNIIDLGAHRARRLGSASEADAELVAVMADLRAALDAGAGEVLRRAVSERNERALAAAEDTLGAAQAYFERGLNAQRKAKEMRAAALRMLGSAVSIAAAMAVILTLERMAAGAFVGLPQVIDRAYGVANETQF